jgi:hypothetical protein
MFGQFGEQAMHAEVIAQHVRVVNQHDGAIGQLRPPAFKILLRLVRMKAINVLEINRAIGEMGKRIIKFAFQQL